MALIAAVIGASLLLSLLIYALPSELGSAILRENGPIEAPTALAFAGAAGVAIWISLRDRWWSGYAVAAIMAAAAARELDFHQRFTTVSIEKGFYIGFLTSRVVPWPEKLAVGAVVVLLAAAAITLVVREHRAFIAGLRARGPAAVAALGGLVALLVAQGFDKATRRTGRALPDLVLLWKAFEETLELTGAVLFLLALLKRRR